MRGFVTIIIAMMCAQPVWAANHVRIDAQVDRSRVAAGEPFVCEVTISLEGSGVEPKYTPPPFDNLQVVQRSTQQGQSIQMGSGGMSVQRTLTYSYVLRANRPGKAKIGAATVRAGNDLQTTEPMTLEVTAGATAQPAPDADVDNHGDDDKNAPRIPGSRNEPIMLQAVPQKLEAYVGEQVLLSVYLLTQQEIASLEKITQPQLEGVLLESDNRAKGNFTPRVHRIGDQEYQLFEIQRFALFPLREGTVTVGSFNVEVQQSSFNLFSRGRLIKLASPPVEIAVKPLPSAGKPPGFAALNVGQYKFEAQLLSAQTTVGKPVTLRLSAQGQGNPSKLVLPTPSFPDHLRAFDPETKSEQRFEQGLLQGKIVREYLVVPNAPGTFTLPAMSFQSFDPSTGQYREQRSGPFTISVTGEAGQATALPSAQSNREGSSFLPPRFDSTLKDERFVRGSQTWVAVSSGSLGLLGLGFVVSRLQNRRRTNSDTRKGARAKAAKKLRGARSHLRDRQAVYATIQRLLIEFLHDRFGVTPGTTRENLKDNLRTQGVSDRVIEAVTSELDNCDFARFAPGGDSHAAAEEALARTETVLNELDRSPAKANT